MIWGNALVEAYNIESNVAIYPRIVISQSLIEYMNDYMPNEFEKNFKKRAICQDNDGLFFVNFAYISGIHNSAETCKTLLNSTTTESKKYKNNPRIIQKYNWLINYLEESIAKIETDLKEKDK